MTTRQAKNQSKAALLSRGLARIKIDIDLGVTAHKQWMDARYRYGSSRKAMQALLDAEVNLARITKLAREMGA